jgi:NAD(P)-dependent dehydrogenase (short-subunit alcohol dehydrogenase family)
MNILITGANGFVGRHLVRRLLRAGRVGAGQAPFSRLTLVDLGADDSVDDARVRFVGGSIADDAVLRAAFSERVDHVFHLASARRWRCWNCCATSRRRRPASRSPAPSPCTVPRCRPWSTTTPRCALV